MAKAKQGRDRASASEAADASASGVSALDRGLVFVQFLVPTLLIFSLRIDRDNAAALLVCVAGIVLHVAASRSLGRRNFRVLPQPKAGGVLAVSGPYRWVRHPMYTALLLFCVGLALAPPTLWKGAALLVLLCVLIVKAKREEVFLSRRYPDYASYAKTNWMLLPPML
ncbi:Isoprenylcysteine carboxyl methyltransferase (ICMT) family protein [Rosistilla carotiformis]|uniref:Isoprenylcysteine carboxyl methyltransferase (ICMT) family protein n=1 Tax=Rosistilla carotiformis TaxID=2528017 RepID=A0A518JTI4_9BACT|nr:isoprenylcysteine carboxylmethyltransferase family protein [Rosistilla carotiformis]QDV68859.1 Isoprenylcysteine carboxyl methyltransferase (ICMT) family protein [Rosistilla carotiformis]